MSEAVDGPLRVSDAFGVPSAELRWRFSRSSGPGGQGVNTTDSRVELSWTPGSSASLAALPENLRERLLQRLAPQAGRRGRGSRRVRVPRTAPQPRGCPPSRAQLLREARLHPRAGVGRPGRPAARWSVGCRPRRPAPAPRRPASGPPGIDLRVRSGGLNRQRCRTGGRPGQRTRRAVLPRRRFDRTAGLHQDRGPAVSAFPGQ